MLTDFDFDTVSYARDKVGRITAITGTPYGGVSNYASGIQYRAWGAPKAVSYGSGFNASANYTARMQVNAFNITGVIGGSYTYNSDGQLSTFVALYDAGMDRTFGYDEFGRMNSSVAGTNGFKATFSPQQDEFGNVTSSTYHYWQNGSFPETFSATYQNNRATTVTDAGQTQTWNYDAMGNRTSMIKTVNGTPTAVEIIQVNARGNAAQSGQPDGDGRPVVMGGGGNFYVRSTVFGAEIVTELDNLGNKTGGRVLDGANLIATLGKASNTISWTHRDPLNLVAREVQQPGQVKRRTFAITPQGAQIETTDGINLSQYYACLYGGNNNPGCTGYNPQAASAYGYLADQANGMLGSGIKVDGALTLRSVNDIMRQRERDGLGGVITGPTLSGTPLAFEGNGSFVRRAVQGWQEVRGTITSKGRYERDYVSTIVDVWEFVPGGEPQGRKPPPRDAEHQRREEDAKKIDNDKINDSVMAAQDILQNNPSCDGYLSADIDFFVGFIPLGRNAHGIASMRLNYLHSKNLIYKGSIPFIGAIAVAPPGGGIRLDPVFFNWDVGGIAYKYNLSIRDARILVILHETGHATGKYQHGGTIPYYLPWMSADSDEYDREIIKRCIKPPIGSPAPGPLPKNVS